MKIIIATLIIAALAASGFFLKSYFDQSSATDAVKAQMETETKSLEVFQTSNKLLATEMKALKAKQEKVQASLDQGEIDVPARMNTTDIVSTLLDTGERYKMTILPLSASDWSQTKTTGGDLWFYKVTMDVSGQEADLAPFLKYLQDSIYPTLIIQSLEVQNTIAATPDSQADQIRVKLGIAIYAR